MKQRDIHSRTQVISEATAEPITLYEAKDQLNWLNNRKDQLITSKITAARVLAEAFTWRAYEAKRYKLYLDDFPSDVIEVEPCPVREIESVEYIDEAGNTQTLSTSAYHVDLVSEPARIKRADSTTWPTADDRPNAIIVTFKAGYEVPVSIDSDTDTITGANHWFSDGDQVRLRVSGDNSASPPTVLSLNTDYYVIQQSGDDFKLSETSGGSAIDIGSEGIDKVYVYTPPGIMRSDLDAMLLLVGHLIENREDVMVSNGQLNVERLPNGAESLLSLNSLRRPV